MPDAPTSPSPDSRSGRRHVVADRGHRQALDRLLQAQLQARAAVHRIEQAPGSAATARHRRGRAAVRRRGRACATGPAAGFSSVMAGAHRRLHAAGEEIGEARIALDRLLIHRLQPEARRSRHRRATGAEAERRRGRAGFDLSGQQASIRPGACDWSRSPSDVARKRPPILTSSFSTWRISGCRRCASGRPSMARSAVCLDLEQALRPAARPPAVRGRDRRPAGAYSRRRPRGNPLAIKARPPAACEAAREPGIETGRTSSGDGPLVLARDPAAPPPSAAPAASNASPNGVSGRQRADAAARIPAIGRELGMRPRSAANPPESGTTWCRA